MGLLDCCVTKMNNEITQVIPETLCEDIDCKLNCYGRCNSINTLLTSLEIHGLPKPLTCDSAIHN